MMLKITLEQWRMFKSVVQFGGFNQASEGINKSQSSIHNAVGKIESMLGVKLFKVEGRKTLLTDAGQTMLRRVNYLLDEASKVESIGVNLGEGVESHLKIAIDEIFPNDVLYQALENVSNEFPHLNIELMESVLSGSNTLLETSQVDIAVSPFTYNASFSEELCQIELIAVSHPEHPLQQLNRKLSYEDLKSHRQIVIRDSDQQNNRDAGWLKANQRWTVSHLRTSIDMIKNGLGFAWLPSAIISDDIKSGKLKPLNLDSSSKRTAQLYLLFKDGDNLGPAARSFLGELRYASMNLTP